MRRVVAVLLALASLLCAADEKRKPSKPPDVEVLEVKCQRSEGRVTIDGRVSNTGAKRIHNLNLLFDFLDSDRQVITTRRHPYNDEILEPGGQAEFQVYFADPVRAVACQVRAETKDGREFRVGNPGPFPIE